MIIKSTSIEQPQDFLLTDEGFLRDFFENSPIGFHVFGPDRIIQAMNRAELEMIGYQRDEVVGKKKWSDLIIPEHKARCERGFYAKVVREGSIFPGESIFSDPAFKNEFLLNACL